MTGCQSPAALPQERFAATLIREIEYLLSRLAETGECGAIDLRSLPMDAADRAELQMFLGQGEVDAKLTTAGGSEVRETKFPGVWWITHRGESGNTASELIEVTLIPEILKTHKDDLPMALASFRQAMSGRQFEFQSGENE